MNCALRTIVCAFVTSFLVFSHSTAVLAKEGKDHAIVVNNNTNVATMASPDEFKWSEGRKLVWSDFRGPVNAPSEESAAATICGIGFKTVGWADGKPKIVVYNMFYATRSWVRPDQDAKAASILSHEQGHFDICEVYARKLRNRMNAFNFNVSNPGAALMEIYNQVREECETRQQAYESETNHGTVIAVQNKWQNTIAKELSVAGELVASNQ